MALCTLAIGCSGGQPPARDPHAPYRAIQRDEAVIERARAAHASPTAECPARCTAPAEACGAADRICAVADDVEESDAATRCRAARQSCTELRAAPPPAVCTCG